jgi:hypothetical protein
MPKNEKKIGIDGKYDLILTKITDILYKKTKIILIMRLHVKLIPVLSVSEKNF